MKSAITFSLIIHSTVFYLKGKNAKRNKITMVRKELQAGQIFFPVATNV